MRTRMMPNWMWSEAVGLLERAERLSRQGFEPTLTGAPRPVWEPPADVIETDEEVLIFVALPGIEPDDVQVYIEGGALVVSGQRVLPPALRTASILRLELPQGRFARRIPLPPGRYDDVRRSSSCGCLTVSLRKPGTGRETGL